MKAAFFILLLLLSFVAGSQVTRYRFKIRFEDYNPLKNSVIIVNNQRLGTDDNGVVDVDIPAQLDRAYVESPNTASYTIRYRRMPRYHCQRMHPKRSSFLLRALRFVRQR